MTGIFRNIVDNPILIRELRRRMRGKALIYSIITYIVLMTISTVMVLLLKSPSPFAEASTEMLNKMKSTGEGIFLWITAIQSLLVLIVAPTITAGMTTGEKERQTFDFLRVTTITRWMYVAGCFLSTAFYVGLALMCALPLLSLTFLYGGVTLDDVVRMFFTLLGNSCVLSAFGLFVSSVCDRTRTAQGIIVFMIFALVFGGFIVTSQLRTMFAGAAAAAAAAGPANPSDMLYFFNLGVPRWIVGVTAMMVISGVFLLLASRKLFEPADVRAFAHWQFAVLFLSLLGIFLGFLGANPFTNELPELAFYLVAYALLLVAVIVFAVGRMEVGDEIWHLKRVFPILRPFDQTVPFLVAIGALYYILASQVPNTMQTLVMPLGLVKSLIMVSLGSFALFCVIARAATTFTMQRSKAGLQTGVVMTLFLLVLPLAGATFAAVVPDLNAVGREIVAFSPFGLVLDGFNNPTAYQTGGAPVGTGATMCYLVLAGAIGVYGESRRYLKWRRFDYHYDMPAG